MNGTSAMTYTSGMADAPDIPDEMRIVDARNQFGAVVEKSRYFGGVTYLSYRGKRVAAIVSAEMADLAIAAREDNSTLDELLALIEKARKPAES
jgi:prevent-host-death family protein